LFKIFVVRSSCHSAIKVNLGSFPAGTHKNTYLTTCHR